MPVDLVIVGGGPAGLATAIYAAQRDLSCVVLDKRELPLDKACGEGLMPRGVRALEEMGVTVPAWGQRPFVGIRYVDSGTVAEGRFASGNGLGVRRTALIEGLVSRAESLGIQLRYGQAVKEWSRSASGVFTVVTPEGELSGRHLIAADGLHSPMRKKLGLQGSPAKQRRFGVRRHFTITPWSSFVEVHWHESAEAYVTPAGDERVGVAILFTGKSPGFDQLLRRFPALEERLSSAPHETEPRGAGPFRQNVTRRHADGVALVGDAAGYADPITGEGMTLAFRSARALVEAVAADDLAAYERDYRRITQGYYQMTKLLLRVSAHPRLRSRVIATLAKQPDLFTHMLSVAAGERPLRSLGLGGAARLLGGLAFSR